MAVPVQAWRKRKRIKALTICETVVKNRCKYVYVYVEMFAAFVLMCRAALGDFGCVVCTMLKALGKLIIFGVLPSVYF